MIQNSKFISSCKENDASYVRANLEKYYNKPELRSRYGQMGLFPIHIAALCGSTFAFQELVEIGIKELTLQGINLYLPKLGQCIIIPRNTNILPFALYGNKVDILRMIEKSTFIRTFRYPREVVTAMEAIVLNCSKEVQDWYEWFTNGSTGEFTNQSGVLNDNSMELVGKILK